MAMLPYKRTSKTIDTEMSRSEFLNFIELDLWSKFQKRLWGLLTVFLTLVTLAGVLGIPYYITSEIDKRVAKREAAFDARTEELLTRAQILVLAEARYNAARTNFFRHVAWLISNLEIYDQKVATASGRPSSGALFRNLEPVPSIIRELRPLLWVDDYASAVDSCDFIDRPLYNTTRGKRALPRVIVTRGMQTSNVSNLEQAVHPVQDGTIGGALRDVKYRLLELAAYQRALSDAYSAFAEFDGQTAVQRRQRAVAVETSFKQEFTSTYTRRRSEVVKSTLSSDEASGYAEVANLYEIR